MQKRIGPISSQSITNICDLPSYSVCSVDNDPFLIRNHPISLSEIKLHLGWFPTYIHTAPNFVCTFQEFQWCRGGRFTDHWKQNSKPQVWTSTIWPSSIATNSESKWMFVDNSLLCYLLLFRMHYNAALSAVFPWILGSSVRHFIMCVNNKLIELVNLISYYHIKMEVTWMNPENDERSAEQHGVGTAALGRFWRILNLWYYNWIFQKKMTEIFDKYRYFINLFRTEVNP